MRNNICYQKYCYKMDFSTYWVGRGSRSKMSCETTFICGQVNNPETHNSTS